jgi:hypothetical protein
MKATNGRQQLVATQGVEVHIAHGGQGKKHGRAEQVGR